MHVCKWIRAPIPGYRGDSVDILQRSIYLLNNKISVDILSDQGSLNLPYELQLSNRRKLRVWKIGRIGEELKFFSIENNKNIDLIHSYPHLWTEGGFFAAKMAKIPIISELLDNPITAAESSPFSTNKLSRFSQKWLKNIIDNSIYVIVMSKTYKNYLVSTFPDVKEKFKYLPQAAVPKFQHPPPKRKNKIVFVGSFMPWHGWHTLVCAAPIILEANPNVSFTFVGINIKSAFNSLEKRDRKILKDLVLTRKAEFLTNVSFKDYYNILNGSQIGIASHITKGKILGCSPMKVFDYLSHGTVVVASDIPELREINPSGDTISYFEENNPESLAQTIIDLTDNQEEISKRSKQGLKLLTQKYNFNIKMQKIITLYHDVLNEEKIGVNGRKNPLKILDWSALRIISNFHVIKGKITHYL